MSEIEEIMKLNPEERIRRMKEVQDKRRNEIEEAENLIKDSIIEIEDIKEKKHAPINQVKAYDISQLLTAEEKRMFRTARFEGNPANPANEAETQTTLEEVAAEEISGEAAQKGGPLYGQQLEREKDLYKSNVTPTGADKDESQKLYSGPGQEPARESYGAERGEKPDGAYAKNWEQNISGTYERTKQEEEKKRKFDVPW